MKQFHAIDTDILKARLEEILTLLQELDCLYHSNSLAEYERKYQAVEQKIGQTLPGFSLAFAEIATAGAKRVPHGGMRHVLIPTERNAK